MIRELSLGALGLVIDLGAQFYDEAKMPSRFLGEKFLASWMPLIESGSGVIFGMFDGDSLVGIIGGLIYPDLYDGESVALEAFWFVKKENRGAGVRLFDALEGWAAQRGAKRMIVTHQANLMPERLKEFYLRKGYRELETNYCKEVG